MPGVNPPPHQTYMQDLANLSKRVRALETQQQMTISNGIGQAVLYFGLIPGSNPAQYGLQFVDPSSGDVLASFVETSGTSGAQILLGGTGVIESAGFTPGSAGFQLLADGNASFNQLTLADGIIGDAALTNPVSVAVMNTVSDNAITYPSSAASVLSGTIPVPSGFSRAYVSANAIAFGYLNGISYPSDPPILNAYIVVGGSAAPLLDSIPNQNGGYSVMCVSNHSHLVTGLSGGNITIALDAYGEYLASGTGTASISAIATFLR